MARFPLALSLSWLACFASLTGCTDEDCAPVPLDGALAEEEAGYTLEEFEAAVEGDHELVSVRTDAEGAEVEEVGSLFIDFADTQWRGHGNEGDASPTCGSPTLVIEADFDLVLGDVDMSGTIVGYSSGPDSARFSMILDEADLYGGTDITEATWDHDIDTLVIEMTEAGVELSIYRDGGEMSGDPIYLPKA